MIGIPLSWHRFCAVGLRGAIAFALSLHLEFEQEKRYVLVTATLIIVLFTVIFLGGMTLPLMKVVNNREYIITDMKKSYRNLSKLQKIMEFYSIKISKVKDMENIFGIFTLYNFHN